MLIPTGVSEGKWVFLAEVQAGEGLQAGVSPLLFAISIEPLAQLIRDSTDISGIEVREEHRLSLYAAMYMKQTIQNQQRFEVLGYTSPYFNRVEGIRMNIVPRLLFLFQTLPIAPPKSLCLLLQTISSQDIYISG